MLQLPQRFLDMYNKFLSGKFVAQLTVGSKFSRVEMNKVIEMTPNKDTKMQCNWYNGSVMEVPELESNYEKKAQEWFYTRNISANSLQS